MLIFVYGSDTFRARAKVRELVLAFKKKYDPSGLNTLRLDAAKASPDELRASLNTPGFLSKRRMAIVDGFFEVKRGKEEQEKAVAFLKSHVPETVVVLWDDLPTDKAAAHPVVKAFGGRPASEVITYSFDPLAPRDLRAWMQGEIKRRSMIVEPQAFELLAASGNNLWQQSGNLNKLAAYAAGRPVLARDVELLVCRSADENIFACMDTVAERDLPRAASAIRAERSAGVEDARLFSMLIRQFRLLLMVQSFAAGSGGTRATMAKELGLHPFVAGKITAQARGFTAADVKSRFILLSRLDRDIKTGRLSFKTAVDCFIGSLA